MSEDAMIPMTDLRAIRLLEVGDWWLLPWLKNGAEAKERLERLRADRKRMWTRARLSNTR